MKIVKAGTKAARDTYMKNIFMDKVIYAKVSRYGKKYTELRVECPDWWTFEKESYLEFLKWYGEYMQRFQGTACARKFMSWGVGSFTFPIFVEDIPVLEKKLDLLLAVNIPKTHIKWRDELDDFMRTVVVLKRKFKPCGRKRLT